MTEYRHFAVWARTLAGMAALAGLIGLSGCGGGSGAPNNVFNTPGPLTVLPPAAVAYAGMPLELTVSGGTPPYKAFSSNPALVPVAQDVAGSTIVVVPGQVTSGTDVNVVITVQDNPNTGGTAPTNTPVELTVREAPLLNSLTITPDSADCGTNAICTGQTGTATVTVLGDQGAPAAGRAVKFDVVAGPFLITTANPAQPLVTSLTVVADANGVASVIIKANANAPTQFAQLRVTDITSGQQLIGNFLIQQVTDGSKVLTVVPATATITGAFTGECSSGFPTDYYIYGGTPPYRVTSTFPASIILSTMTVNVEGGFFRATTNGSCVDPLTFSIVDATGRQTTALLHNVLGTTAPPAPTPPATLAITPTAQPPQTVCTGRTFTFIASGGTPPYSAVVTPTPPGTAAVTSNNISVSGLLTGSGVISVTVFDQSKPQMNATATITCNAGPAPPPLVVLPGSFDYSPSPNTCVGKTSAFVITGGTPPYTASFPTPPVGGGTITPTVIANSGQGFTVTGLQDTKTVTNITVSDSSSPKNQQITTITCP